MKKFVLALLAVVLVLGLSAVAFADCDHSYEGNIEYVSDLYDATCTANKVFVAKCKDCGEEFECEKPDSKDPYNHNWVANDHDVTQHTDCTKVTTVDYHCTRCKATFTDVHPGNASHNWETVEITKQATCTENGSKKVQCANPGCEATSTQTISKTNHDYRLIKASIGNDPCEEDGYHYYECNNCHDKKVVTKFSEIWKNGKLIKIGAYGDADDPNCNINLSAKNHAYDHGASAWTINVEVIADATCTEAGSKVVECEICHARKTTSIPALGHAWTKWTVKVDPRCTVDGMEIRTCTRECCWDDQLNNAFMEVRAIPAPGHVLGEVSSVAATCTEAGSKTGICATCEQKITETIPATGHAYGEWTIKDGLKYKVCANCNDIVVEAATPVVPETPADPEDKPSSGNGGSSNTGNGGSSSTGSGSDASIPATGDNTSNAPYIMMVAAVAGLVVLVASKRKVNC